MARFQVFGPWLLLTAVNGICKKPLRVHYSATLNSDIKSILDFEQNLLTLPEELLSYL